jgi:hypothetical protein
MLKKLKCTMMILAAFVMAGLVLSFIPQAAYCAGMPDNIKGKNIDEPLMPPSPQQPPFPPEGFAPPDGPGDPDCPPPGHMAPGMKSDKFKNKNPHMDFLKKLTPEQREEAKKYMTLGKSYNDLADVYVDAGKVDEAIAVLKKLAAMKLPSYIPAEHLTGKKKMVNMRIVQIYLKGGKDAEALAEAETMIKTGELGIEEQAHLYSMMGNVYKKKGEKEKAAEMLKKTIDLLEKNISR